MDVGAPKVGLTAAVVTLRQGLIRTPAAIPTLVRAD